MGALIQAPVLFPFPDSWGAKIITVPVGLVKKLRKSQSSYIYIQDFFSGSPIRPESHHWSDYHQIRFGNRFRGHLIRFRGFYFAQCRILAFIHRKEVSPLIQCYSTPWTVIYTITTSTNALWIRNWCHTRSTGWRAAGERWCCLGVSERQADVKCCHGMAAILNDVISKPIPLKLMRIYLKSNPAKFHPDPMWNDRALGFFWRGSPNRNKNNEQQQQEQDE